MLLLELKCQTKKNKVMKKVKLIDAQKMNKLHPTTFEVPSKEELDGIKEGDSVKIGTKVGIGERFWVTVTSVDGGAIKGVVNNDLVLTHEHGLVFDDEIEFKKKNVYSIYIDN